MHLKISSNTAELVGLGYSMRTSVITIILLAAFKDASVLLVSSSKVSEQNGRINHCFAGRWRRNVP